GYGVIGDPGPLNDYWSVINEPEKLAQELIEEGYQGLKTWSFDFAAHKPGGPLHVSREDVIQGVEPFRRIRAAVGDEIELIVDGHGFFQWTAAVRIAKALEPYDLLWAEDLLRVDCVDTLADFRRHVGGARLPLAVSEMFSGPDDYRLVLEKRAADFIMIDPTWVGGVSQTRNITKLAQLYNIPVVMHDCTGPLTLLAGIHVGVSNVNVAWQESLRSHLRLIYPKLINETIAVDHGYFNPPQAPGLGGTWLEDLFAEETNQPRSSIFKS
ncbi:MAG: mandelate racemase/muconate lactonizing enzyme family protein, partial [Planctomycetales bacterium]